MSVIDPNNVEVLREKGHVFFNLGKYREAIKAFNRVLKIEPQDIYSLHYIGTALDELGEHEQAIKFYDHVLKIDFKDVDALHNKGASFANLGKYQEAIKLFDQVLEIDPAHVKALFNKGVTFANLGKYLEAIEFYDEVLKIDTEYLEALNNKVDILDKISKNEKALDSETNMDTPSLLVELENDPILKKLDLNSEKKVALKTILANRNTLVTARAGSGKTFLLLTLIRILINHSNINKDQILLLSFAKKIAENNKDDLCNVFSIEDFNGALTIHSLAHKIVAIDDPEIRNKLIEDQGNDTRLVELIEAIVKKEENKTLLGGLKFKLKYWWYLKELEKEAPLNNEYTTLLGEDVKSEGEKIIADFLFENGVEYHYEKSYKLEQGTYKPDFTLMDTATPIIIEFWGLRNEEYLRQAEHKRALYRRCGLKLIEITPNNIFGDTTREKQNNLAIYLEKNFRDVITINPLSEEEKATKVFTKRFNKIIVNILRFIKYARVQRKTPEDITFFLNEPDFTRSMSNKDIFFSELSNHIYNKYVDHLVDNDLFDFSQLLERATKIIDDSDAHCSLNLRVDENTRVWLDDIKWLLVDEFQDMSPILHLFISKLQEKNKDLSLVCVGDDWQAIYGFVGNDTKYMSEFESLLSGTGSACLPTNRRSAQAIVDVGNNLMNGYGEKAITNKPGGGVFKITLLEVPNGPDRFQEISNNYIISARGIIDKNPNKTIAVLRRNNKFFNLSKIEFEKKIKDGYERRKIYVSTIHSFKGNEADIVIIMGVTKWNHPFLHPERTLMKILGLNDDKIQLEERRLFYVAITRARESVYFITETNNESIFITDIEWE